jgi:hypothetical protein
MKRRTARLVKIVIAAAAVIAVALVIVSKVRGPEARNVLSNPGFEQGDKGWQWLSWSKGWAPFVISGKRPRTGASAALLAVRSKGDVRSTIVWGVVQELTLPIPMPDCLEGYYYVDGWTRGARNQYIQAVIIDLSQTYSNGNAQIRYILSGVDTQPYNLGNAHYVFADPAKPTTPPAGTWIRFSLDPAGDFERDWKYVPAAGHKLRVLFEARYDNHGPGDAEAKADVYYDDLYLGPATRGHCD